MFSPFSDVVGEMLQDAMESCEQEMLMAAFLIARQACLEGQHVFQSYTGWFHVSITASKIMVALYQ